MSVVPAAVVSSSFEPTIISPPHRSPTASHRQDSHTFVLSQFGFWFASSFTRSSHFSCSSSSICRLVQFCSQLHMCGCTSSCPWVVCVLLRCVLACVRGFARLCRLGLLLVVSAVCVREYALHWWELSLTEPRTTNLEYN